MTVIKKYRAAAITICLIFLCMMGLTRCIDNGKDNTTATSNSGRFKEFVGSASCISCHKSIYDSHINTAHFHSSQIADSTNIKGHFETGNNSFTYNSGGQIAMEKTSTGFYQVAYINGVEKKRERFDITIGSGAQGQSYASWVNDKLVQLPITYFTSADAWSNSPGYPD